MSRQLGSNDFADAEVSVIFIAPFDDVPRRSAAIGTRDELLGGCDEIVIVLMVVPVFLGDLVAPQRIGLEFPETLFLLRRAEVHPKLQDQSAVVHKCVFEADDFRQAIVEFPLVDIVVYPAQ